MIKSMTGFSRFVLDNERVTITVEIKSLNQRYLEVIPKIPRILNPFEIKIKEHIKSQIKRGRVEIYLALDTKDEPLEDVKLNLALAKQYHKCFHELTKNFNLGSNVDFLNFLNINDIIQREENIDVEKLQPDILKALDEALCLLIEMRLAEGKDLYKDIMFHLARIDSYLSSIKERIPDVVVQHKIVLQEKAKVLFDRVIENDRLEQEMIMYAEKLDITEEIVRMDSHFKKLKELLNNNDEEAKGRKMDFLIQEIYREINTSGVKSQDANISQEVVEIKSELEKIREQIQNIE